MGVKFGFKLNNSLVIGPDSGGGDVPSELKAEMNEVFNRKFGTSQIYDPDIWADTVNIMGPLPKKTATGAVASFSDAQPDLPLVDLTAQIVPFQDGTGDPSPQNVRTIHGYTGAHIGYVDFNQKLFELGSDSWESSDATFADGVCTWTPTAQYSQVLQKNTNEKKIYITKGHVYFFSVEIQNANAQTLNIYSGGAYWLAQSVQSSTYKKYTNILTASVNTGYWRLIIQTNASSGWGTLNVKNIQIFDLTQMFGVIAESVTTDAFVSLFHKDYYEKTDGGTLVTVNSVNGDNLCPNVFVTWQTEVGTVYVGTIDLTTGLLTVTHEIANMADLSWSYDSTNTRFFTASLTSVIKRGASGWMTDIVCSCYQTASGTGTDLTISEYASTGYIYLKDTNYDDVYDFKASLTGQQFTYPLATSQTYQLTPKEVKTLLGVNNIFADTGNSSVTYYADINAIMSQLEAQNTSNP